MSILCKCLHIGLDNIRGQIDSKCCHKESECMNWVSFHGNWLLLRLSDCVRTIKDTVVNICFFTCR